jgi:hypothetical protein
MRLNPKPTPPERDGNTKELWYNIGQKAYARQPKEILTNYEHR